MINDSAARYGALSKLLHWLMALLIINQFFKLGDRVNDGDHWLGNTFGSLHGSVGALVLVLVIVRVIWALTQSSHRPQLPGIAGLLARGGHIALYLCMFLMPLTGIFYVVGNGYGLKVFGQQLIARGAEKSDWMVSLGELHSPIAWVFLVLLIGHIGMALLHHFVKRDDTLRRML